MLAYGAGLLSSYGEMKHMRSGEPWLKEFDPFSAQPKMSYKDGFQKGAFGLLSPDMSCKQSTWGLLSYMAMWLCNGNCDICHQSQTTSAGYFVLDSFEKGAEQLKEYCKSITPK